MSMNTRLRGFLALFLWLLLGGCPGDDRRASPAPDGSPDPAVDSGPSGPDDGAAGTGEDAAVRDAGSKPPDAATGKPRPDAEVRDAGTGSDPQPQPPDEPASPTDASVRPPPPEPAPDSGAAEEPASPDAGTAVPRSDGCPDDAPLALDRVRILPAPGHAALMVGARIQGSNSGPTTDFVDLVTVTQPLAASGFSELTFQSSQVYRYLRYYAAAGGVAELELYHGATRLAGVAFGTASSQNAFANAFDADPDTYFSGAAEGGNYVGLDIARGYVTATPTFSPSGSATASPLDVTLSSATEGATIRYTVDGSNPSRSVGTSYAAPIHLGTGRTSIRALAYSSCRFDSPIGSATYTIGAASPVNGGLKSYHLGNSLTDTINPWLEPIADSTGVDHVYARWTIPGAPIRWLNEHKGDGFQDPDGASQYDSFVQSFAPIDHLSIQPFSDPDFDTQGGAAVALLTTALAHSPNVQLWVYAQWPGQTEWNRDAFANGGGSAYPEWQVPRTPTSWEAATRNQLLYQEAFRDYVDSRVGGKPILIVPGGLALVELKRQIDAGLVPGIGNFFGTMFDDEIHLSQRAQYLVSLVFYACLYRQSPEGRATYANTGLTAEQATIFQRIAWDVASGYSGSGIAL